METSLKIIQIKVALALSDVIDVVQVEIIDITKGLFRIVPEDAFFRKFSDFGISNDFKLTLFKESLVRQSPQITQIVFSLRLTPDMVIGDVAESVNRKLQAILTKRTHKHGSKTKRKSESNSQSSEGYFSDIRGIYESEESTPARESTPEKSREVHRGRSKKRPVKKGRGGSKEDIDDVSPERRPGLEQLSITPPTKEFKVVKVFYATDRKPTGSVNPSQAYGSDRSDSDSLSLGTCEVSIPADHVVGELESPSIWRLEFHEDPEKHIILQSVSTLDELKFYEELSTQVRCSKSHEVLVFIHGFNVTFEDAARRTAQMACDLQFNGAPVFFSWPSKGKLSLAGYRHDSNNIKLAAVHLEQFLRDVASNSEAKVIHLIAHSMGNQALTEALASVAAGLRAKAQPIFTEVVLTAPDIDAEVFKQMSSKFGKVAKRITLYASSNDRALIFSKKYQGNYPRAGDSGNGIVVVSGLDSIDVSGVDTNLIGHFYYGDNDSVLSDMYYLLRERKPPGERFGLLEKESPDGKYWVFQPRKR